MINYSHCINEIHHDGFLLPPTPYTTQQSVCSLPVPVPWTYPDVAAFSIKPLNLLLHRLCALIMPHTALTGVSSASHQHPYWSENLSNKLVMSAVLQSVLSPRGTQSMWWNFPSLHLLIEPSFYIGSGAQQVSEHFWALPSHKPSSVRAVWRRHLEQSAPCLSYTLALDELSHGHLLTILTTAVCSSAAGPLTCSITALNSVVMLLYSEGKVSTTTNQ